MTIEKSDINQTFILPFDKMAALNDEILPILEKYNFPKENLLFDNLNIHSNWIKQFSESDLIEMKEKKRDRQIKGISHSLYKELFHALQEISEKFDIQIGIGTRKIQENILENEITLLGYITFPQLIINLSKFEHLDPIYDF